MVFSSLVFLLYFLPVALLTYYLSPRRARHLQLTLVSYVFYGWVNPLFCLLMLISTAIDYVCGLVLAGPRQPGVAIEPMLAKGPRTRRQRIALTASILSNLSMLAFFKYFNFFVDSVNRTGTALGAGDELIKGAITVVLPLGISFYTFQSMSYAIDVYRGDARPIRSFIDFACYVAMFPQLVAGPIVRFQEIADQLRERSHTAEKFARGVAFFAIGLAKKTFLANPCGKVADTCFDAGAIGTADAWWGVGAYAFQIYFDFSAYSDMAIGLGLMTGFVFPKNFDSPYRAQSITEFWQRWHLSLSTWLREYLYIPLGGNRRGERLTYVNLALVMLIGGLWHGASWNFVIWGGIHGGWLALERWMGRDSWYARMPMLLRVGFTFSLVNVAWVFFRAADLGSALDYLAAMAGRGGGGAAGLVSGLIWQPYYLATMVLATIVVWACPQTWDWTRRLTPAKAVAVVALLFTATGTMLTQSYNPFIYFIF